MVYCLDFVARLVDGLDWTGVVFRTCSDVDAAEEDGLESVIISHA